MGINVSGNMVNGIFIKRENRFLAKVMVDGIMQSVHVPNTGRMAELLVTGAPVILRKKNNPGRKTNLELLMVYKNGSLICIDSRLPNDLVYSDILSKNISEFINYNEIKREVQYKNSRFDLFLSGFKSRILVEVKCATLFEKGIARFPDAPTERGRKHLSELIDAVRHGIKGAVVFIVFSEDVLYFKPNDEMDKEFGRLLREAYLAGVSIHAYSCIVKPNRLELKERLIILI